jgi:predicted RNA binding protein YcfA (HicA-like mRNA interferase family)
MPGLHPVSRRELIRRLRRLGFEGPEPAGRHQYMTRGSQQVFIPNPHRGDIDKGLLATVLRQAGISREEWESVA